MAKTSDDWRSLAEWKNSRDWSASGSGWRHDEEWHDNKEVHDEWKHWKVDAPEDEAEESQEWRDEEWRHPVGDYKWRSQRPMLEGQGSGRSTWSDGRNVAPPPPVPCHVAPTRGLAAPPTPPPPPVPSAPPAAGPPEAGPRAPPAGGVTPKASPTFEIAPLAGISSPQAQLKALQKMMGDGQVWEVITNRDVEITNRSSPTEMGKGQVNVANEWGPKGFIECYYQNNPQWSPSCGKKAAVLSWATGGKGPKRKALCLVCCHKKLKQDTAEMYTEEQYAGDEDTTQEDLNYHEQILVQQGEILRALAQLEFDKGVR